MVNAEAAGCLADCFSTGRPQSAHRQKTAHRRGFSGTGKAPLLYFIPFRSQTGGEMSGKPMTEAANGGIITDMISARIWFKETESSAKL